MPLFVAEVEVVLDPLEVRQQLSKCPAGAPGVEVARVATRREACQPRGSAQRLRAPNILGVSARVRNGLIAPVEFPWADRPAVTQWIRSTRPKVWACLEQRDRRAALREPRCDDTTSGSSAHHYDVIPLGHPPTVWPDAPNCDQMRPPISILLPSSPSLT